MDPLWVTADATAALAFVGAVSIVANFALAKLTRDELDILKRQTELLEKQHADNRATAFPHLKANFGHANNQEANGELTYVTGLAPALDIEVWVRSPAGYYRWKIGLLGPNQEPQPFTARLLQGFVVSDCPFPEFQRLQGNDSWIGVRWKAPTGQVGTHRRRYVENEGYVDVLETVTDA